MVIEGPLGHPEPITDYEAKLIEKHVERPRPRDNLCDSIVEHDSSSKSVITACKIGSHF